MTIQKEKAAYICQTCGTSHSKMQGRCSGCGEWNSLVEELVQSRSRTFRFAKTNSSAPRLLEEIAGEDEVRILTPDLEFNRVLGGGIVAGSIVLLAGEPGIGKSTLMLQIGLQLTGKKILYISGEESDRQIRLRASRLSYSNPGFYFSGETDLDSIVAAAVELKPDLLILDSIQTVTTSQLESGPGTIAQVRECSVRLMRFAKETSVPIIVIGHITKDGSIAGPKVLEHTVDTVLNFEGEHHNTYRIIRTSKNRFGSTLELGIYEMTGGGLMEVANPSEIFLTSGDQMLSGSAVSATMEGLRPILIETQALVSPMAYGTPQRSATGFDIRRLNMLLAVLEKRCGMGIGGKDVFVNLAGGIRIEDPALDLGLAVAVASSLYDIPVGGKAVFAAEIGLSGELRSVSRIDQRVAEAAKLGFATIWIADSQIKSIGELPNGIAVRSAAKLQDVIRNLFRGD